MRPELMLQLLTLSLLAAGCRVSVDDVRYAQDDEEGADGVAAPDTDAPDDATGEFSDPEDSDDPEVITVASVSIAPEPAFNDSVLSCEATLAATTVDEGDVSWSWSWRSGEGTLGGESTLHLAGLGLRPNDTVVCEVSASHDGVSAHAEAAVSLDNRPPQLDPVQVAPLSARAGEVVRCEAEASDPDDDPIDLAYAWSNGAVGREVTLMGGDDLPGHTLTCTVTAADPWGAEVSRQSGDAVAVENTPPVVSSVSVSPASARVGDTVLCSAEASDADGDDPTLSYAWSNGAAGATLVIDADDTPGAVLHCTATATDAQGASQSLTSTTAATVENTPPLVTSVEVSPTVARVGDTITCTAEASDPHGAPLELSYGWTNGASGASLVLTASDDPGTEVRCTVTATDPEGDSHSLTSSAGVTVVNTPPVVASVVVSPASARVGDPVTCSAEASDADGDVPALSYTWSNGASGASLVIDAGDAPGTEIQCTVTATDPQGATHSLASTAGVTVENTPPLVTNVEVSTTVARVGDTITCTAEASDPHGAPLELSYGWTNGASGASIVLTASDDPGTEVRCTATATDPEGDTHSLTSAVGVTVENTPPVVSSVSVSPASARVGDTVLCSAEASDADGDVPTLSYAWSNGASGASLVIDAGDAPGTEIQCTVTATDPQGASHSLASTAGVTVENTPPLVTNVEVTPTLARVGDTITCTAEASDPHGAPLDLSYGWTNGASGASLVLTASDDPGTEVRCTVTATDPEGDTHSLTSAVGVTVENTPPVVSAVQVSPATARVGDTVTCSAEASDADGDALTLSYAWSNGATGSSLVVSSDEDPGDTLSCTVTATDPQGDTGSLASVAGVVVENTPPVITSVTVEPSSAKAGESATCTATATDADGDDPTLSYAWSNGATGATIIIAASEHPGTEILCTATAEDPQGALDSQASATGVVVENEGPVVVSVEVSPSTARVGDTVTCSAVVTPEDGDGIFVTYDWLNGSSGASMTLTSSDNPGDTVACSVTAVDSFGDSDTTVSSVGVVVENTPPVVSSVQVSPSTARAGDTVMCSAEASDADGDMPTLSYAWSNGASGASLVLDASDAPGTEIQCTATAEDPQGATDSLTSTDGVTVQSAPLALDHVVITPATPTTTDEIVAIASVTNPDGGSVTVAYAWTVGGSPVGSNDAALASANFTKGQLVAVTVTVSDDFGGFDEGTASVIIGNTPPSAPGALIGPEDADEEDDLWCEVTTAAQDPDVADGVDTLTYTFSWTVDGEPFTGATHTATESVVSAEDVEGWTVWACTVTASDGDDVGPAATGELDIAIVEPPAGTTSESAILGTLRYIPSGEFTMGCVDPRDEVAGGCIFTERPPRDVTLTMPFWMMETEFTLATWLSFGFEAPFSFTDPDGPIETITWWEALHAANAISDAEGLDHCYILSGCNSNDVGLNRQCDEVIVNTDSGHPKDCEGWRLPTEAEWEYAARAGTDLPFSGSADLAQVAWYSDNNSPWGTKPVCSRPTPRNAWGLCDMTGNVDELVWDWHATTYSGLGTLDPAGPASGAQRMRRGGFFNGLERFVRIAYRQPVSTTTRSNTIGFRLVRSAR